MDCKLFEVRDRGTFIPVMAIRLESDNDQESWLLRRAGYAEPFGQYIVVIKLAGGFGTWSSDPYEWGSARTMQMAHRYMNEFWNDLEYGDVIDVEYILKEKPEPAESERVPPPSMSPAPRPHVSHRWMMSKSPGVQCRTCGCDSRSPAGAVQCNA